MGQAWTRNGGPYLECSRPGARAPSGFALVPDAERVDHVRARQGPSRLAWSDEATRMGAPTSRSRAGPAAGAVRPRGRARAGAGGAGAAPTASVVAVLEFFMIEPRERGRAARRPGLGGRRTARLARPATQAEEALRASEECFRLLVESVEDCAIFELDPNGQVASWNPGARSGSRGYRARRDPRLPRLALLPARGGQDGRARAAPRAGARRAAASRRADWRVRSDGLRFWAGVVITPLCDAGGELARVQPRDPRRHRQRSGPRTSCSALRADRGVLGRRDRQPHARARDHHDLERRAPSGCSATRRAR